MAVAKAAPDREGLFLLATEQAGHFTTAQAAQYGVGRDLLSHLVRSGTLQRIYTGVYRFRDYPETLNEHVVAAWLAVGEDSAVVSHESALDLWELTDLIPDAIHLSVSRKRRNLPKLPGVRIHTAHLPIDEDEQRRDIWRVQGMRATSPQRTLLDVASAGVSPEHVIVGIRQARDKGWIDEARLRERARARSARIADMVDRALQAQAASPPPQ